TLPRRPRMTAPRCASRLPIPPAGPRLPDSSFLAPPSRSLCNVHVARRATVATIEQLHGVHCARSRTDANQPRTDLHQASRVPGGDCISVRLLDVPELAIEDAVRRLRLYQIVNPRGAAAHVAFHQRNELEL